MFSQRSTNSSSQGTRLDPWLESYADRANNLRASEIRALFAVVSRPEVVSLAGGMPNLADLPLDDIAASTERMLRKHGTKALQYGSGQGDPQLREQITEVMTYEGIRADPDDVVVTTGSQQAVDLVSAIFLNPGDVVLAESPSYVGALGVFNSYQAEVRHIDMDDNGLIPEALEEKIKQVRAEGRTIKFLYTIPNFHNPAGVTLAPERRPVIAEICRKYNILILEDNPYGLLGFDSDPLQAIQSYNPEGVIYLGSFSKIFCPGYRVGWALAPHAVREKLVLASESAILSPTMMGQMSIGTYLAEFDWYQQVKVFRGMYRERRDTMLAALEEYMPYTKWTVPAGGFYTWVTLPEGLDARAMLPRAVTGLVAYVSGTAFYSDGQGGDHMRLSFCYPTPERIKEGVRRLATVIEGEKQLVELFGTNAHTQVEKGVVTAPGPDQV